MKLADAARVQIGLGAAAVAALLCTGTVMASEVRVVDGDTIVVDGERIRILGLDAPEIGHAQCADERQRGLAAKAALAELLAAREPEIERHGRDRYRRTLAVVRVAGRNVAAIMIRAGHARLYWGGKRRGWCRPPAQKSASRISEFPSPAFSGI
ncbi:thermonuclease family protein [Blastochloris tepida]|uniref:TNase-like domain-containing protein n=1 Tax=Blastochloris tepida TaxID=2233851 RepID=A0A348FYM1_9HYPH|nr:thermonuclease family protein [Blastochloris tepida]BBF92404.1 hypothetical protein BLTE_10890 [Blastochloris tepida]